MQKVIAYFKRPYEEKGFFLGMCDVIIRIVTAFVWLYLLTILFRLVWDSLLLDYNPLAKVWWFSYSFFIFFGASWLAYILLFVRDYYEED
jgi:hypothetical protein